MVDRRGGQRCALQINCSSCTARLSARPLHIFPTSLIARPRRAHMDTSNADAIAVVVTVVVAVVVVFLYGIAVFVAACC